MNSSIKRILALATAVATLAATLAACDETDITAETETARITEALTAEETVTRIPTDLPDYDWNGYNFKILTKGEAGSEWDISVARDIAAEEETGEVFNDAIFYRNRNLDERYNFTIEHLKYPLGGENDPILSAVLAGDDYFDAASLAQYHAVGLAKEGLFVNLLTMKHLDLEKPWWDQGLIKNATLSEKLFFISGDSVLINRDSTTVMLFNKGLIEDYGLENPYELVRNNKWTVPKFSEMAAAAAADLNGDHKMDYEIDRYGYISSMSSGLSTGAGLRYSEIDAEGQPVLTFAGDRNYRIIAALHDIYYSDYTWLTGGGYSLLGVSPSTSEPEEMFAAGRGLFFSALIRSVENLRGAEVNFGIIPVPKFDEDQKEWGHSSSGFFGDFLCVPNLGDKYTLERTGFVLEALTLESHYTTIPAWYDVQLTTKFARDAESKEMLDIVFSSIVWDPYTIYGWGDFNPMQSAANGRLASAWASGLRKTEIEMRETIKMFDKID